MADDSQDNAVDLVAVTARLVAAYVGNNAISRSDLSHVIGAVHAALNGLGTRSETVVQHEPAVPIRKSVTADALTCLECGSRFKFIKRHLATSHGLLPDEYRTRWGLPRNYPMTAPSYSATRSELAKRNGLGRKTPFTRKRKRDGRAPW